ncbi:hypothetical protein N7462_000584 [Penicillium macrosclerotiorum]|uniref:uncharacterized protein n=1 Tax=Penicillium macrosclerotiorum TaxID=303699 RepID=UPI0025473C9F|nr:uncharacterized protein N7462_000584 [Penicillium macrosclerotiorum]KAJ5698579.1 hypothetical protein N7462_000584 [Penicillium macrosclerotiorum]
MKFFQNFAILSIFTVAVSGASKFADTCENIEGSGTMIRAECQDRENGQLQISELDLNRCIKNSKGSLKISGNFQASCINCSLRGHTEFECQCRNVDDDHRYVSAHIDLSK